MIYILSCEGELLVKTEIFWLLMLFIVLFSFYSTISSEEKGVGVEGKKKK